MRYPSVEVTECIQELHALIERYDIQGDPRWLLRRIKKVMLRHHRALSVLHRDMEPAEKEALTLLMKFEAMKRYSEDLKTEPSLLVKERNEKRRKFDHIVELWSTCEDAASSMVMRRGPLWVEGSAAAMSGARASGVSA